MILDVLMQEGFDQNFLRVTVQVIQQSIQFFIESALCLLQVSMTTVVCDQLVRFHLVVALSFLDERFFEFLFINFLLRQPNLNQHLNCSSQLSDFNNASLPFFSNLREQFGYELVLNLRVEYHMMLELADLEMFDTM